ncbi:WXG100-like domain-containing protein [Micromonospora psammae]|uniref:WXG100-like domain-containing protein n=1 Tax=Micromonospora sp. CPCC 205556 TaxID=3122398 RepID=UPI002FF03615
MTSPNPLMVGRSDSTTGWSGIGLAEDIDLLATSFRSGSRIDGSIGGFAAGMDALALVVDPLGQLVSWGVGWLIEHVKPLSDALDWLAGDPDQISAYAATWANVAAAMRSSAADLRLSVVGDLTGWTGDAAAGYRAHVMKEQEALSTLGAGAEAMATITTGAGLVVALVRETVRDLIADFVSVLAVRLWEWLALAGGTLGAATPWVITQVSTLAARWAAKIARLVTGLLNSLRRLAPTLRRLDDILTQLDHLLRGLARRDPTSPVPRGDLHSRGGTRTNRDVLDNGSGTPMTVENAEAVAARLGIDLRGIELHLVNEPDEVRYLDSMEACAYTPTEMAGRAIRLGPASFADEETLAVTIAHEYHHVVQLRNGDQFRRTWRELEDEAYAVEPGALERFRGSR